MPTFHLPFTVNDRDHAEALADKLDRGGLRSHADMIRSRAAAHFPRDAAEAIPERWEMFSAEADQRITAVIRQWADEVLGDAFTPQGAIDALDARLATIERDHGEIHDTEPREHLAATVKPILRRAGLDPMLSQRSRFAASIWDDERVSR